ncbi:MAG: hypothetical protein H6671_11800 [Anaerolineaceae bacterium]|nr:hypothetical protein [Anaerolineaceae bacterium]
MDGLVQTYNGQLVAEYANVGDADKRPLKVRYSVTSTPITIIFNERGQVVAIYQGLQTEATLRRGINDALAENS